MARRHEVDRPSSPRGEECALPPRHEVERAVRDPHLTQELGQREGLLVDAKAPVEGATRERDIAPKWPRPEPGFLRAVPEWARLTRHLGQ